MSLIVTNPSVDVKNLAELERACPEATAFVAELELINSHVAVNAPVKCGKSIMKMIYALRAYKTNGLNRQYYVSAFNRRDEASQRVRLGKHNLRLRLIYKRAKMIELVEEITQYLDLNQEHSVVIHLNESDYGTDKKQCLNTDGLFYALWYNRRVKFIMYSATNEEVTYSRLSGDFIVKTFIPSADYRGAGWSLDNKLMYEAKPFWDFDNNCFTAQGAEAIKLFKSQRGKYFGVIRFVDGFKKIRAEGCDFVKSLTERGFDVKFIGCDSAQSNTTDDDDYKNKEFDWATSFCDAVFLKKRKTILLIAQTATRSTEVKFHQYISFWHDYRPVGSSNYATMAQAMLRVAHYGGSYKGKDCKIRVYGNRDVFLYAAGRISAEELVKRGVQLADRIRPWSPYKTVRDYSKHIVSSREEAEQILRIRGFLCEDKTWKGVNHVSENNSNDIAEAALYGQRRSTKGAPGSPVIYHIDSYNKHFVNSWVALLTAHPGVVGKYVVIIPEGMRRVENTDYEPEVKSCSIFSGPSIRKTNAKTTK